MIYIFKKEIERESNSFWKYNFSGEFGKIIWLSFQPFRVQIVWHKFIKKHETNYMPYSYANTKMV